MLKECEVNESKYQIINDLVLIRPNAFHQKTSLVRTSDSRLLPGSIVNRVRT